MSQVTDLSPPQEPRKRRENKLRADRMQKTIQMRAENSKIEKKKFKLLKLSYFLEKINKTDKLLARLAQTSQKREHLREKM